jgi:hypothetical protein
MIFCQTLGIDCAGEVIDINSHRGAEENIKDDTVFVKNVSHLCVPCASARKQVVKPPASTDLSVKCL